MREFPTDVAAQLSALPHLSAYKLRSLWVAHFISPVPRAFRRRGGFRCSSSPITCRKRLTAALAERVENVYANSPSVRS